MPKPDTTLVKPADMTQAIGLLTRLPLTTYLPRPDPTRAIAASAWAWPIVGAGLGLLAGLAGLLATTFGASAGSAAGVTLATMMLLTGALHEDGLADTADGLWGGQNKERRLEILKDSRVGSYGVLALTLATILRWSAITMLFQTGWVLAPLMAMAALSRLPMVLLLASLPNARGSGLAATTGRPAAATLLLAVAIGLIGSLALTGWAVIAAAFWIALTTIALAALAKAKIGGQTGDILGASQQLAEVAALTVFAAILT